ncbi:AraC family transcriptional regulator [Denitrificimonas caeni]|uniref:AraC family transcriptional regulator n=1 Tax=Denitrificimonas caeni TaxID=521720 RepID=UPI0019622CF4|nr:helix-turn-helix transcriptional regulator [Denitrificimonas caeni]
MQHTLKIHQSMPQFSDLPAPLFFRYDEFDAQSHHRAHAHAWGQLNYSSHGVMQLEIEGQRFISPPSYAVWIPPHAIHSAYNRHSVVYRSVYLDLPLCADLPQQPCSVMMNDILKAILNNFAERDVQIPRTAADQRLGAVLLDQLHAAAVEHSYLPYACSAPTSFVVDSLRAQPGNTDTLATWADRVFVSERTLARQFVRETGISFGEWRQRLRFLTAIERLETAQSIKEIAFDLGYSSPSAFISMFQRHAQCTPEHYRRQRCN